MKVVWRGEKKPAHPWIGRYLCAYCKSIVELGEEDAWPMVNWGEDQREGYWVEIMCPVCDEVRSLMDCDHVTGRCNGMGFKV